MYMIILHYTAAKCNQHFPDYLPNFRNLNLCNYTYLNRGNNKLIP